MSGEQPEAPLSMQSGTAQPLLATLIPIGREPLESVEKRSD
jgi:hypothetical protein